MTRRQDIFQRNVRHLANRLDRLKVVYNKDPFIKIKVRLIKSVLHSIIPNIAPGLVARLGQKSSKPRPLKVTLHEPSDVFIVLKNKHKLRASSTYSSIRISPDRTIMQRNQLRDIIEKLEERKTAGETNLVMKFVKGVPTISKN